VTVSISPNPQSGGSPLIGCPQLLIQFIRSSHTYLKAAFSFRNLRKRHAVETRTCATWSSINARLRKFQTCLMAKLSVRD